MNNLQVFNNSEFGELKVIKKNGEPWFVGKEIAEMLGYVNSKDALSTHVDGEDKGIIQRSENATFEIPNRGLTIINESGLYSLILSSKLPSAKRFKHWVTSEVLPAIRKHGGYINGQEEMSADELIARAVIVAQSKLKEANNKINEMTPKALFADAVTASKTSILIGEFAKLLRQNGYEIGQNRLFEKLRREGYLIRGNRSDRNMPTQRSMDLGLFEIKETTITHSDGHITVQKTVKVTGKGQVYFINRFLQRKECVNE